MKTDIKLNAKCVINGTVSVPLDLEKVLNQTLKEYILKELNNLVLQDRFLDLEDKEAYIGSGKMCLDILDISFEDFS